MQILLQQQQAKIQFQMKNKNKKPQVEEEEKAPAVQKYDSPFKDYKIKVSLDDANQFEDSPIDKNKNAGGKQPNQKNIGG
jgi:hypothetical protein